MKAHRLTQPQLSRVTPRPPSHPPALTASAHVAQQAQPYLLGGLARLRRKKIATAQPLPPLPPRDPQKPQSQHPGPLRYSALGSSSGPRQQQQPQAAGPPGVQRLPQHAGRTRGTRGLAMQQPSEHALSTASCMHSCRRARPRAAPTVRPYACLASVRFGFRTVTL
jgi:hypothetical protein